MHFTTKAMVATALAIATLPLGVVIAEAKSCTELRALCWTMRDDKSDCAGPYRRCLKTGKFITPLGRVFTATSRK